jgi:hypothetical protein
MKRRTEHFFNSYLLCKQTNKETGIYQPRTKTAAFMPPCLRGSLGRPLQSTETSETAAAAAAMESPLEPCLDSISIIHLFFSSLQHLLHTHTLQIPSYSICPLPSPALLSVLAILVLWRIPLLARAHTVEQVCCARLSSVVECGLVNFKRMALLFIRASGCT